MRFWDFNAFSLYSLRKKASNKSTFCGGVSFWLLPYGKAFSWGIVHFNAISSVLLQKNGSNKSTSAGGGSFWHVNLNKISSKYHQNIIKTLRDKAQNKSTVCGGGPPPFRKCIEIVDICGYPGDNRLPIWEKSKTDPSGGPPKMYFYSILSSFFWLLFKGWANFCFQKFFWKIFKIFFFFNKN